MEAGRNRCDDSSRLPHAVAIREARPGEWEQSRALRLEMLADSPHSFGDALDDVRLWPDDRWRIRHESQLLPDSGVFVAVDVDGCWVGHMAVREFHNYTPPRAMLQGAYVSPGQRGTGTAVALLGAAETWARGRGFAELYLDVQEYAAEARRFYERHGFVTTGASSVYPLDPSTSELEMVKRVETPSDG